MQLHNIKPLHKGKKAKKIARGGKRGTTSGRGTKGQKSRAGARIRPQVRDLVMKFPKKRGWSFKSRQVKPVVINLEILEKNLEKGALITPRFLISKGIIEKKKGMVPEVKILGTGALTKKFDFKEITVSKSAREKIEKAGGVIQ